MKRILSILVTLVFTLGLVVTPVFALDNTTPSGVNVKPIKSEQKATQALQNNLKRAQAQLKKLTGEQATLEANILKAIEKGKLNGNKKSDNNNKQIANGNVLQEKWLDDLNKAALHDVQELTNLNDDIAKWTEMTKKQQASLNQQLTDIDTYLNKQLSELDKKLITAKTDLVKQNIATARANDQKYASQRKVAVNTYLTSIQAIFADRQKVWAERKEILTRRQTVDTTFRKAMADIKLAALNDKLASLSQIPVTPSNIEVTVRAKYQKTVDAIKSNITKVNATIADLQSKLNK